MKVSHVIFKVKNLEAAFHYYTNLGYKVSYGSKNNPHNALIYFSEGPYIELLEKAPLSTLAKMVLKLIGKRKVIKRLEHWEKGAEGFFEICLETDQTDFKKEGQILKNYGEHFFITKSNRRDPLNRLLKWKLLFPDELDMPFLMTYFNIDPKPKNFVHPNGTKKITRISYRTKADLIPLLHELCDDDLLLLSEGKKGVQSVIFDHDPSKKAFG